MLVVFRLAAITVSVQSISDQGGVDPGPGLGVGIEAVERCIPVGRKLPVVIQPG
jgi:hypothetical protein